MSDLKVEHIIDENNNSSPEKLGAVTDEKVVVEKKILGKWTLAKVLLRKFGL